MPEREDLKISVHEEIGRYAADDAVVASSSSGLLPSRLQSRCRRPERLLIGHPFAPVYLLPLVELVGGEQTSPEVIRNPRQVLSPDRYAAPACPERDRSVYRRPTARESLYREALHLINDGVATVPEIERRLPGGRACAGRSWVRSWPGIWGVARAECVTP
ncbi:MAG: hypothetical protein Ct9H300mP16_19000 [Pseudomonadota bacterium]|nr:MAG: hypothetical protein Ct9H300mP16_19000 [Pseudomonadota bacterium]